MTTFIEAIFGSSHFRFCFRHELEMPNAIFINAYSIADYPKYVAETQLHAIIEPFGLQSLLSSYTNYYPITFCYDARALFLSRMKNK